MPPQAVRMAYIISVMDKPRIRLHTLQTKSRLSLDVFFPLCLPAPLSVSTPDVFGSWMFYDFAETNVSPAKKKGWSSTSVAATTLTDDSDEEMSVFKQPGKKRKVKSSKYFVSCPLIYLNLINLISWQCFFDDGFLVFLLHI